EKLTATDLIRSLCPLQCVAFALRQMPANPGKQPIGVFYPQRSILGALGEKLAVHEPWPAIGKRGERLPNRRNGEPVAHWLRAIPSGFLLEVAKPGRSPVNDLTDCLGLGDDLHDGLVDVGTLENQRYFPRGEQVVNPLAVLLIPRLQLDGETVPLQVGDQLL